MGKQIGIVYNCTMDSVAEWFDSDEILEVFALTYYDSNWYHLSAVMPGQFYDDDTVFCEDYLDEITERVNELGLEGTDLFNEIAYMTHTKYIKIDTDKYLFYRRCSLAKALWYYSVIEDTYHRYRTYFVIAEVNDPWSIYEISNIKLNPEDGVRDYDISYDDVDEYSAPFICNQDEFNPHIGNFFADYASSHGGLVKFLRELYPDEAIPNVVLDLR